MLKKISLGFIAVVFLYFFCACEKIDNIKKSASNDLQFLNSEISNTSQTEKSEQKEIANPFLKAKIGDNINFGKYEQDNDTSNSKEIILWRVLDVKDDRVLVISVCNLDVKAYNTEFEDVTWETCTLRSWLNEEFYETAFSPAEQRFIALSTIINSDNPKYGTDGGNDTQDKVFLLSIDEAKAYFNDNKDRLAKQTSYVRALKSYEYDGYGWWWLRSPGRNSINAAGVYYRGSIFDIGDDVNFDNINVRPAMWIKLK